MTLTSTVTEQRQQDFYTEVRQANKEAWNAMVKLVGYQREWAAQNYTETLGPGIGENSGLVAGDLSAVIFDAANAVADLLATNGYSTGMTKLL